MIRSVMIRESIMVSKILVLGEKKLKTISFVGEARVGRPWMERCCSVSSPALGSTESPREWLRSELTFQRPTTRLKSVADQDRCIFFCLWSYVLQRQGIGEPSVYHAVVVIFLEFFAWGLLTTPMLTVSKSPWE